MIGRRARAVACAAGLLFAVVPAAPAAAHPTRADGWANGLSPAVGLASNLNTTIVAGLRDDGHVVVHDEAVSDLVDAGRPGGPDVTRLAVSAQEVYALLADGTALHFDTAAGAWRFVRDGLVDLLASRDGATTWLPNGVERFDPYLYGVDRAGTVWRGTGQSWTAIGGGAGVGSLAERGRLGLATLFELTADRARVLEWLGSPGSWGPIGGPASSVTANLDTLVATGADGKPLAYLGRPRAWGQFALPAGTTTPFDRGGRAVLGERSMYYRTGTGELYGVRTPDVPGVDVVTSWWHLAAATVSDIAPHHAVPDGADAAVLRSDGRALAHTWGTIGLFPITVAPYDGAVGVDYFDASAQVSDWTGAYGVLVRSGSLPPGLGVHVDAGGRVVLDGRPTMAGTYPVTLRAFDDVGAVRDLSFTVVVQPAGTPVPTSGDDTLNPTGTLELANCVRAGGSLRILYRDATANTGWTDAAGSPAAPLAAPDGTCAAAVPGSGATVRPPADHLLEVVALDPALPQCAGRVDPGLLGCVRAREWVTGVALDGPARLERLT